MKLLGKLDWSAIPFDQPIPLAAGALVVVVILGVLVLVVAKGWAPYVWNEWICSVDHKRMRSQHVRGCPGHQDTIAPRGSQSMSGGLLRQQDPFRPGTSIPSPALNRRPRFALRSIRYERYRRGPNLEGCPTLYIN